MASTSRAASKARSGGIRSSHERGLSRLAHHGPETNYGIRDYIEKPFRIADLMGKVNTLLAHDPRSLRRAAGSDQPGGGSLSRGHRCRTIRRRGRPRHQPCSRGSASVDPLSSTASAITSHSSSGKARAVLRRHHGARARGRPGSDIPRRTSPSSLRRRASETRQSGCGRSMHAAADTGRKESIKAHLLRLL